MSWSTWQVVHKSTNDLDSYLRAINMPWRRFSFYQRTLKLSAFGQEIIEQISKTTIGDSPAVASPSLGQAVPSDPAPTASVEYDTETLKAQLAEKEKTMASILQEIREREKKAIEKAIAEARAKAIAEVNARFDKMELRETEDFDREIAYLKEQIEKRKKRT